MKSSFLALACAIAITFVLAGCVIPGWTATNSADAIAVWQHKGDTFDIYYSIWDHNAKQWYVPGGKASAPIAVDAGEDHDADVSSTDDFAVAVWSKEMGGSSIYYSTWQDNLWSGAKKLSEGDADTDPTVSVDPAGNALAVWISDGKEIYYSFFTRGGGWSAPSKLDAAGISKVSLPELAYNEYDGRHYIVFTGRDAEGNGAFAAAYASGSWSPVLKISDSLDAAIDNNVPTGQRTGIAAAKTKNEITAVFPVAGGEAYSVIIGGRQSKFADGEMPDDAYDAGEIANGAYSKSGDLFHDADVFAAVAEGLISSLADEDSRASLTFIRDRSIGLAVWWSKSVPPGEIFSSYYEAGKWSLPMEIDRSLMGGYDRNPAVTPLSLIGGKRIRIPYCGDMVLQPPEQCEIGIACPKAGDVCMPNCQCKPKDYYYCGDGVLDWFEACEVGIPCANPNKVCQIPPCSCKDKPKNETKNVSCAENTGDAGWFGNGFNAAAMVCKDDCKEKIGADYICNVGSCTCTKKPENKTISCAQNTKAVNYPASLFSTGMQCKDDCAALNPYWKCDPEGCFCEESRTVTPRCGDGYVSGPNTAGGGFEECDVGFGFYQPKDAAGNPITSKDTCPPPTKCDPPTCKCKGPAIFENITNVTEQVYHNVCDYVHQTCEQIEGAGQSECSSDSQCSLRVYHNVCDYVHQTCEQIEGAGQSECSSDSQCSLWECGNGVREGSEQCDGSNSTCGTGRYCTQSCTCAVIPMHSECDYAHGTCEQVSGAGANECSQDSDCEPPVINCPAYCETQGYSQSLGGGYSSPQACQQATSEGATQCHTTCTYAKYYTETNNAGTSSCCCKHRVLLPCSNCPAEQGVPVCPPQSACEQNAPGGG
jgi:hypothetical protein